MFEFTHGFTIDEEKCDGCLACMRACPTQAIRVKRGKAELLSELCVDCGLCLTVCPTDAIQATTRSFAELDKFKYKVAVPSPVLFGQFPPQISPAHIIAGLHGLGFDAVWDFTVDITLVELATLDYVTQWKGPRPLLSVSCPVIVRLVQVLYPNMLDQFVQLQLPRELAGRELKRRYSEERGIDPTEIAAIYITPCQAKTISILEPAEGAMSNLDGALGIADVYNDILALAHTLSQEEAASLLKHQVGSADVLRSFAGKQPVCDLPRHRYMSVTGLSNVIQVFDDIEKGKLRNIDYLECNACRGGCLGGNLTVDNIYVTLSKIQRLLSELSDLPLSDPELEAEIDRRYPNEDFSLKGPIRPRVPRTRASNLRERVARIKAQEAIVKDLPGLDCGLCGAPTCRTFAKDVAAGTTQQTQCVFHSDERVRQLRKTYLSRQ